MSFEVEEEDNKNYFTDILLVWAKTELKVFIILGKTKSHTTEVNIFESQ